MDTKHVVFDCDDVLANLRTLAAVQVAHELKRPVSVNEFTVYDIKQIWGDDFDCDKMFGDIALEDLYPDQGAVTLTTLLREKGYRTTVVTARGYHQNAQLRTVNWLRKHNIHIDEVIVVPMFGDKKAVLAELGHIDYYVEDNHGHASDAHELDNIDRIYLLNRPWNQNLEDGERVIRVNGLYDIIHLETNPE